MILGWHVLHFESPEATKNRFNAEKKVPYIPPISQGATLDSAIVKSIIQAFVVILK